MFLSSDLGRNLVVPWLDDFMVTYPDISLKLNISDSNIDLHLVRRWCVAGNGLAVKSCLDMSNDLLSGNVVNVMPEYQPRSTELWLICPSRQSITPAVRLLRDMLRENCKRVLRQLIERGILGDEVLS